MEQRGRVSLWLWIVRRRWAILATTFTILTSVAGIFIGIRPAGWEWLIGTVPGRILVGVFGFLAFLFTILNLRDIDTVEDLQRSLSNANGAVQRLGNEVKRLREDILALFESNLKQLAEQLGFGFDERITVYEYGKTGFEPIGRYSLNRTLRAPGRSAFPENEGVCGMAWQGRPSFVDGLPNPNHDLEGYVRAVEERCNINANTVRRFKMKSRCVFGLSILDPLNDGPVAVIVFESLNPSAFNEQQLRQAMLREENRIKHYLQQRRVPELQQANGGI